MGYYAIRLEHRRERMELRNEHVYIPDLPGNDKLPDAEKVKVIYRKPSWGEVVGDEEIVKGDYRALVARCAPRILRIENLFVSGVAITDAAAAMSHPELPAVVAMDLIVGPFKTATEEKN